MSEEPPKQNIPDHQPEVRAEFRRTRIAAILLGAGVGVFIGSFHGDLLNLLGLGFLERPIRYLIIAAGFFSVVWWVRHNRALKKRVSSSTRPHSSP